MTSRTGPRFPFIRSIGLLAGTTVGIFGYTSGWPLWTVLAVLGCVPAVSFVVWMYTGPLRRYRFLFGIIGILVLAGTLEAWEYGHIPETWAKSMDLPKSPGAPNLYFEYDLPGVWSELFPDEPDALWLRSRQLGFCSDQRHGFQTHPFCRKFQDVPPEELRKLYEAALSAQPKLNQDIYYNYVEILIHDHAPQEEVDAAVEEWRRLFPMSKRPDPREFFGGLTAPPTDNRVP